MSVTSSAYDRLHSLVVSGTLPPGARLAEIPLAAQLGVSRPTMREALRCLQTNGLAQPDGRSLRVAGMSPAQLRSALLMRAQLEALHAELVATRVAEGEIAPAQLRRLGDLAELAESATDAGDIHTAVSHNRAFHQMIDRLAESPVSAQAADALWDRILVATRHSLTGEDRREVVSLEHRRLIAAIAGGEPAAAAEIALRHARATLETVAAEGIAS